MHGDAVDVRAGEGAGDRLLVLGGDVQGRRGEGDDPDGGAAVLGHGAEVLREGQGALAALGLDAAVVQLGAAVGEVGLGLVQALRAGGQLGPAVLELGDAALVLGPALVDLLLLRVELGLGRVQGLLPSRGHLLAAGLELGLGLLQLLPAGGESGGAVVGLGLGGRELFGARVGLGLGGLQLGAGGVGLVLTGRQLCLAGGELRLLVGELRGDLLRRDAGGLGLGQCGVPGLLELGAARGQLLGLGVELGLPGLELGPPVAELGLPGLELLTPRVDLGLPGLEALRLLLELGAAGVELLLAVGHLLLGLPERGQGVGRQGLQATLLEVGARGVERGLPLVQLGGGLGEALLARVGLGRAPLELGPAVLDLLASVREALLAVGQLGAALVEPGAGVVLLGLGLERVHDALHGRLLGDVVQQGGDLLALGVGQGGAVLGGEHDLAPAAGGLGELLLEAVRDLGGGRAGDGDGGGERAAEGEEPADGEGQGEHPGEDHEEGAAGGAEAETVEQCRHGKGRSPCAGVGRGRTRRAASDATPKRSEPLRSQRGRPTGPHADPDAPGPGHRRRQAEGRRRIRSAAARGACRAR